MALGDVERSYTINLIGKDKTSAAFRSVNDSASRTSRIMSGLTKTLKYAAFAAGAALAAAAAMGAKYLWDATKAAYADDNATKALARTQRKAQDATKQQTKATAKLIDKLELASTFTDNELRPALAALALTGMSVKKSQDLLSVAVDVAAAKGKSLQTVAEALAKAYNGNTSGLSRLGVAIKDASGNSLSFAEILKTLKKRTEGAAAAAARNDPWTVLKHAMEQVKEEIGKSLLPMFRQLARWLIDKFVPWIKGTFIPAFREFTRWIQSEAVPWIQNKLVPALKDLWHWFQDQLWPSIRSVYVSLGDLIETVKEFFSRLSASGDAGEGFVKFLNAATLNLRIVLFVIKEIVAALGWMIDKIVWLIDHQGPLQDALKFAAWPAQKLAGLFNADGGYLPGRARGGWVKVGEYGPEMLNTRTGYMLPHSRTMGDGGGGVVVNVTAGVGDPVAIGREVARVLRELKRAQGGAALGIA